MIINLEGGEKMSMIENLFLNKFPNHSKASNRPVSDQEDFAFSNFLTYNDKLEQEINGKSKDSMENELSDVEKSIENETPQLYFLPAFQLQWLDDEESLAQQQIREVEAIMGGTALSKNEEEVNVIGVQGDHEEAVTNSRKNNLHNEATLSTQLTHLATENHLIDNWNTMQLNFTKEQTDNQVLVANILQQFEKILAEFDLEEVDLKSGKIILNLLNQWTSQNRNKNTQFLEENGNRPERMIWDKLVHRFETRTKIQTNTSYSFQARVTPADIVTWLTNGMEEFTETSNMTNHLNFNSVQVNSLPMSKTEQYIIHINPNDRQFTAEEQLIHRFQDAVKSSRLFNIRNGVEQLTFSIRPENLGEMTVKLARLNGEIIVKILVSSHATKQVLEANMHQLKNTFAPHQVVVEETESAPKVSDTNNEEANKEQLFDEQQDNSGENHSKKNNQENTEEEMNFHDLLINAKV